MFTVMIVEDSKPIIRNIQQQIEKSDSRVKVVKKAYNGVDALAILQDTDIDIMITDIRMPKMDGLALIEQALNIKPNLKTVLLTGYNDFEHARRAIQLNVSDYLLKPLDASELKRVLNRIIGELQQGREEDNDEWLATSLRQGAVEKPIGAGRFVLSVLRQGDTSSLDSGAMDKETLRETYSVVFPSSLICMASGHNVAEKVVYCPLQATDPDEDEPIRRLLDPIRKAHPALNIAYCIGNHDTHSIRSLYLKLSAFIDNREVLRKPQLLHWTEKAAASSDRTEIMKEQLKLKYQTAMRGSQHELSVENFREMMYAGEDETIRSFQSRFELFFRTITKAADNGDTGKTVLDRLVRQSSSYSEATDAIFHQLVLPLYRQSLSARSTAAETLASIDSYLQANLYGSITLQELGNELNYSPSYIIRLFKKHRGMTPMEYYIKLKTDEAKRLIQEDESMLMKDIAEALHFYDQHHFAKIFKQYANESPSEYRKRVREMGR